MPTVSKYDKRLNFECVVSGFLIAVLQPKAVWNEKDVLVSNYICRTRYHCLSHWIFGTSRLSTLCESWMQTLLAPANADRNQMNIWSCKHFNISIPYRPVIEDVAGF